MPLLNWSYGESTTSHDGRLARMIAAASAMYMTQSTHAASAAA